MIILILLCSLVPIEGLRGKGPFSAEGRQDEELNLDSDQLPAEWKHKDAAKMGSEIARKDLSRSTVGPDSIPATSSDVCMTDGCVITAGNFLQNMDFQVDPCKDFYHFMCGNWIRDTIIPQASFSFSHFGSIAEKVDHHIHNLITIDPKAPTESDKLLRNFFQSCMDEVLLEKLTIEPAIELLISLGITFPMVDTYPTEKQLDPNFVLRQLMINLMADTGLIGLDVRNDNHDAKNTNLLYIYQPVLPNSQSTYLNNDLTSKNLLLLYKTYLIQIVKQYRDHVYQTRQMFKSDEEIEVRVSNTIALEIELARILHQSESLKDDAKKITFKEFRAQFDIKKSRGIDLADVVVKSMNVLGQNISDETLVSAPQSKYFKNVSRILGRTSHEVIVDYLVLKKMVDFSGATTSIMRKINLAYKSARTGIEVPPPRWKHCVKVSTFYFGAKLSELMIQNEDGSGKKNETQTMIAHLREAYKQMIEEATWMDKLTKAKALDKLAKMKGEAVFSGKKLTPEMIDQVYSELDEMDPKYFLKNLVSLQQFWTKKTLKRVHGKPQFEDINDQSFDTSLVNAMYTPNYNMIWIPFGILHFPFFRENRLASLNYGALGAVVGHEMTHGFDNLGANFDSAGNLNNWWSNETKVAFKASQQCFIDQYGSIELDILKAIPNYNGRTKVNGNATLGENIADNGGIREAYRAYKNHVDKNGGSEPSLPGLAQFSGDKLFFMSYASMWCETQTFMALVSQISGDPHPPHAVRVTQVMRNMPEFASAFQCKKGDNMVIDQSKRCQVW